MPRFRQLPNTGPHKHKDGRVTRAGDVIEHSAPLDTIFLGKFKRLGEKKAGAKRTDEDREENPIETVTPYDTAQTKKHPPTPVFEAVEEPIEDAPADYDEATDDSLESPDEDGKKTRRTPAKKATRKPTSRH